MKKLIFFSLFLAFGLQILAQSSVEFNVAVETFNTSCGLNNGQLKVFIEGGQPPYVVLVDGVPLASPWELKNLSPGFRRVDVTDQAGNKYALYKAQIDPSTNPILSLVSKQDENCGKGDGWFQMKGTSGVTPYSFKLPNGKENFSGKFEDLKKGDYLVTLTDGHGCTDVKSVQVFCDKSAIVYSKIITIKVCDSTKTFKLDSIDSKMKSVTGLDSFSIFKYVFDGKPIFGKMDSIICGPESMFGQTRSVIAPKTLYGCDSFTVVTYKSGYDTTSIKKMSCSLDTTLPIVIHRVNKCDSIVLVTYFPAPAPFVDIVEKVSCVKTGFDTIHHYFNGLLCLRDSFMEVIKYLPVKVDTITTSLKTCDQNSAQALLTEKVQKNADSCVVKVFMKEVLWTGLIPRNITVNKDTCDAKLKKLVIKDTIPSLLEGKCDSIYLDYIYSVHKPFLRDSLIRVCSQSEVKPDISVKDFTYYGCDSIVTIKYVYTAPILVPLGDSIVCGTKNSTNLLVKSLAFTGSTCDSAVLTQKVITYESPKLHIDKIVPPTYEDGVIDLSASGGTTPYSLKDKMGNQVPFDRKNLIGGIFNYILTDANLCTDEIEIILPQIVVTVEGGKIVVDIIFNQELKSKYGVINDVELFLFDLCNHQITSHVLRLDNFGHGNEEFDIDVSKFGILIVKTQNETFRKGIYK